MLDIYIERAVASELRLREQLHRSRSARPDELILTMLRPLASSRSTSPRSLASSQTGSLGQDVRHASITSSYVLSRVASRSSRSKISASTTESLMIISSCTFAQYTGMSLSASEIYSLPFLLLLLNSKLLKFPLFRSNKSYTGTRESL
jgi:formate-dependent nitrite reductase membrane component NrfD